MLSVILTLDCRELMAALKIQGNYCDIRDMETPPFHSGGMLPATTPALFSIWAA
jgi:hypothetical protein